MKRMKVLGLTLSIVLAVGLLTAIAAAAESTPLPNIRTALSGEIYPLNLGGHLASKDALVNESGSVLSAKETSLLLNIAESTSLGKAVVEFLGVENGEKSKCHSEGDSETNGVILVPGAEWHLVYTNLSPAGTLELGALVLFTKFTITCDEGLFEITLTGPSTKRIAVRVDAGGVTLEVAWHCGNQVTAIQEIPYYYNDTLERVPTTLLANPSGTGNKKACEETEGTMLLSPETGSSASQYTVLW